MWLKRHIRFPMIKQTAHFGQDVNCQWRKTVLHTAMLRSNLTVSKGYWQFLTGVLLRIIMPEKRFCENLSIYWYSRNNISKFRLPGIFGPKSAAGINLYLFPRIFKNSHVMSHVTCIPVYDLWCFEFCQCSKIFDVKLPNCQLSISNSAWIWQWNWTLKYDASCSLPVRYV